MSLGPLKTHANGHKIVGQQHTTLLALVAYSLKPVEFLAQQVPTLFCSVTDEA